MRKGAAAPARGGASPRRILAGLALASLVAGAAPHPAHAQWPLGAGSWWVKLSGFSHETTETFTSDGSRRPFFAADARSESRALFLDAAVGVHDVVDLWLQLPWFDLAFEDAADLREVTGFGDARLFVRYGVGHHLLGGLPLSVRIGAKAPLRDFPIDAEVIPVGEGQWDVEAWLEGGHSFHPLPVYAVAWVGYRWRLENTEAATDPGDERLFLVDVGLTTRPVGAKVVVEGLFGLDPVIQGVRTGQDRREIVYLQPELLVTVSPAVTLEVGWREPLHGRNHPAGRQLMAAVFVTSG